MKTKDVLVIGGIGLLAYMLLKPKPVEGKEVGGMPFFMSMPSAQAPLDIGSIFSGMASMFSGVLGAMPEQIVPEINIPEFKFPDIEIPEFPSFEGLIPDWEKIIPAIADELKIPSLPELEIPKIPGISEPVIPQGFPSLLETFGLSKLIPDVTPITEALKTGGETAVADITDYIGNFSKGAHFLFEEVAYPRTLWDIIKDPLRLGEPVGLSEHAGEVLAEMTITPEQFQQMSIAEREAYFNREDEVVTVVESDPKPITETGRVSINEAIGRLSAVTAPVPATRVERMMPVPFKVLPQAKIYAQPYAGTF